MQATTYSVMYSYCLSSSLC